MQPRQLCAGAAILVTITLAAYSPALGNGFIWDDDDYVTANIHLRTGDGLRRIWTEPGATLQYYPAVHTGFWIEYHLWGLNPFGYHLVNILLHAGGAVLFWLLLRRLAVPGAFLAGLVFAVHPVHVESVAWITERKNVLSGLFYLGAALAWLRYRLRSGGRPQIRGPRLDRFYAISLILFLCALLSKTVTVTLPAALMVVLWWKTGRVDRRDFLRLAPFFVLGISLGLLTAWLERHQVGARGIEWGFTPADRILIAGRAVWFYLAKLALPVRLTFIYPRWQIDAAAPAQYLYPLAAALALFGLWRWRGKVGRGPLAAVLYFGGTLVPALGFFDVYPMRFSFVADHFQYLASLGPITLAAAGFTIALPRLGKAEPRLRLVLPGIVICVLGLATWQQARIYRDRETLFRDTVAKNPAAWMAHQNLGALLLDQGKVREAVAHLEESLRLYPDDPGALNNLGLAHSQERNYEAALAGYREALRLLPVHMDALNNLAWLRATCPVAELRNPEEAVRLAEQACTLSRRRSPMFLDTLAAAYAAAGRFGDAVETASDAIALARQLDQPELVKVFQERLELYRTHRPFVE